MDSLIYNMIKKLFFLLAIAFSSTHLISQSAPPFWNDILAFRKADSASRKISNPILLIGSSSFTLWKDVNKSFPSYSILNRGFGGSRLLDQIRYAYDVIFPYQPKQILIYCGENDLADDTTVSAMEVVNRFKTLFLMIRQNLPDVRVDYISMKPSPSRVHLLEKKRTANSMIRDFLAQQKNAGFVDVFHAMLDEKGGFMKEIYLNDDLHMNEKGYAIWVRLIERVLLE